MRARFNGRIERKKQHRCSKLMIWLDAKTQQNYGGECTVLTNANWSQGYTNTSPWLNKPFVVHRQCSHLICNDFAAVEWTHWHVFVVERGNSTALIACDCEACNLIQSHQHQGTIEPSHTNGQVWVGCVETMGDKKLDVWETKGQTWWQSQTWATNKAMLIVGSQQDAKIDNKAWALLAANPSVWCWSKGRERFPPLRSHLIPNTVPGLQQGQGFNKVCPGGFRVIAINVEALLLAACFYKNELLRRLHVEVPL